MTLAESYEHCRRLHRAHGRTYYLATRLLPRWKRRHVHALYGFTRSTDDIVDVSGPRADDLLWAGDRERRLEVWEEQFRWALAGRVPDDDPVLPAIADTVARFDLDRGDLDAFLTSMRMDLEVTAYDDYDDLLVYMDGSAAVIGTLMLPILLAGDPESAGSQVAVAAREPARQLGLAFQLTNFIRDVAADNALGRVYLPQADLARFGVSNEELAASSASPRLRRLLAFETARAREHYQNAWNGLELLPPRSRRCIRLAHVVYSAILDEIERADFDVLAGRVTVPVSQRAACTLRELSRPA